MAQKIDLSQLTPAQLEEIGNQVLRALAKRVRGSGTSRDADPIGPYNKHRSQHLNNSIVAEDAEMLAEFE